MRLRLFHAIELKGPRHTGLTALIFALIVYSGLSQADDIDVFLPNKAVGVKPNVLLLLDYSASMNLDVNGDDAATSGLPSRLDILHTAVDQFLDTNLDTLKVGYSVFLWAGSGIRWPITDLNDHAHNYDPAIPLDDTLRVIDVMKSELREQWAGSGTNTVSALVEAALYFQGGNVAMGGVDTKWAQYFEPNVWTTSGNYYEGWHDIAANPITYQPSDAFKFGIPNGAESWCYDYTVGGTISGQTNECASITQPLTCTYNPGYTTDEEGGTYTAPPHDYCTYEYPDHWAGANYIPPAIQECQKNILLLISDGEPENGWDYNDKDLVLGHSSDLCEDLSSTVFAGMPNVGEKGNCAIEVARKLHAEDQDPTVSGSNLVTHTIGFNTSSEGQEFLRLVAEAGGGSSHTADNLTSLNQALNAIAGTIGNETQSFSPLAVDINRAQFSHDNRAFVSLFKPSAGNAWSGNLKGYFLDQSGLLDINGNSATAMDGGAMVYSDTAQSFWSLTADGAEVEAGGASGKIDPATRKLYTFTGNTLPSVGVPLKTASGEHDVALANTSLSQALMGVSSAADRDAMIDWIRSAPMGDALHSQSVTVDYGSRKVVYAMTNQGLFHAFDATSPTVPGAADVSGGEELFAFLPPELLPNLQYLSGTLAHTGHVYGLDGQITRWHEDGNGDGIVNGSDTVMLIFGQRRGGKHYYALDVTNPDSPVYKWKITGGVAPFQKLAQTWSDMSLVTVNYSGSKKRVLAFGGGYDAAVNDAATTATPGSGNSVFIVDRNGSLLWQASATGMDYSIPSDLTIIDASDNGMADRIYVGDMGGNIWRIDMDDVSSASSMHVTKFAALDTGAPQPFFYPPAVSLESGAKDPYLSIAIGSGNRANPLLDGTSNRIYALRDKHTDGGTVPAGFTTITLSDLYNATSNLVGSSDPTVAATERKKLNASDGWYVELASGEKILSAVSVFEGRLLTTTMSPQGVVVAGSCGGAQVNGHYHSMSVRNAVPIDDATGRVGLGKSLAASARRKAIRVDGIPNTPQIVSLPGNSTANVMVDQRIVDTITPSLHQVYWYPEN